MTYISKEIEGIHGRVTKKSLSFGLSDTTTSSRSVIGRNEREWHCKKKRWKRWAKEAHGIPSNYGARKMISTQHRWWAFLASTITGSPELVQDQRMELSHRSIGRCEFQHNISFSSLSCKELKDFASVVRIRNIFMWILMILNRVNIKKFSYC